MAGISDHHREVLISLQGMDEVIIDWVKYLYTYITTQSEMCERVH